MSYNHETCLLVPNFLCIHFKITIHVNILIFLSSSCTSSTIFMVCTKYSLMLEELDFSYM